MTLLVTLAVLIAVGALAYLIVDRTSDSFKKEIKDFANSIWDRAELRGLYPRAPAFITDYHDDYPGLKILEDNYETIRGECLALLRNKKDITDMENLGGAYTAGGIHSIAWKTFMFKTGSFIEENCALAPGTTALLKQVPGLYTAFFSILDPHQYITPHYGYYKGFLRYHLGVLIPNDNKGGECWIRVNPSREDNLTRDKSLIERGARYYWKDGEGVLFDDTYLHDAENASDDVRVVMWIDIRRKLPFYLQAFNIISLAIANRDASIKRLRDSSVIRMDEAA